MEEQANKSPYGTALLKAARILQYLSEVKEPQGVSEIARNTGLSKATAYKLLETLCMVSYVEKLEKSAHYRLGIELVKLATASLEQLDIVQIAHPFLEQLNDETGETIHLGMQDGMQVVYVDKLESRQNVRMYSRIGKVAPLYCTGIGKTILSAFDAEQLEDYFRKVTLRAYTETTIVDKDALKLHLEEIRSQGFARDNGEHEADVRCVAVPISLRQGGRCAISVSAPSYRVTEERMKAFLDALRRTQVLIHTYMSRFV